MKKKNLIILIFIIMLFIGVTKVEATTYNGKLYEVWHPDSGFTVFAAESNGYMDYNSWMIKSTIDNRVYYCIDPALPLEGSYVGSHSYYEDYRTIMELANLSLEKYKKINLLAYYGYGYKDNEVDHTDKKWYGITQVMIWRIVRPDLTWTFKENRNATPNNNLFRNEVNEMNSLVNKHYLMPSFYNETIKVLVGQEKILTDTNKVISRYKNNGNPTLLTNRIEDNKLYLYSETPHTLSLLMKMITRTAESRFALFVSNEYQDIIALGEPVDNYMTLSVEVTGGMINLQKTDKTTGKSMPQGEASLKDAVYEVYNKKNTKVGEIITDEDGKGNISLEYGTYILKEKKPPKGYELNDKEYQVNINQNNYKINLTTEDSVITGKLKIHKEKGGSGEEFTPEENAIFDILDHNNNKIRTLKTNEKGLAIAELPYGKYTIHQVIGDENYVISKDKEISMYEDKIYEVDLQNLKLSKMLFAKRDFSTKKPIPNTTVEIYKEDDTLIYKGRTNKKGLLEVPNLEIGKYYILEKNAPKYYRINTEKMFFEVKENGKVIKATMEDERKEGNLFFKKIDITSKKALKDALIAIYWRDNNNKLIYKGKTDKKGLIKLSNIKAGKYCLQEKKAPQGYIKNKKEVCFEISEEKQLVKIVMSNSQKIKVPNTIKNTSKIAIIMSVSSILLGSFTIYESYKKN